MIASNVKNSKQISLSLYFKQMSSNIRCFVTAFYSNFLNKLQKQIQECVSFYSIYYYFILYLGLIVGRMEGTSTSEIDKCDTFFRNEKIEILF